MTGQSGIPELHSAIHFDYHLHRIQTHPLTGGPLRADSCRCIVPELFEAHFRTLSLTRCLRVAFFGPMRRKGTADE